MEKCKVLIISSLSPYKSANLGLDIIMSLKKAGYDVDFLTQDTTSPPNFISTEEITASVAPLRKKKKPSLFKRLISTYRHRKDKTEEVIEQTNQFVIISSDETCPPIQPELIVEKISEAYKFAIILFWQGMLTTRSLESIYNKIKAPLFIFAVDMFPFTGGCFYFWNCKNFIHSSCGMCPGLNSQLENDATRLNFIYKQQIYQKIECVFLGNKWMRSYINKTPIVAGKPVKDILLVVNENIFKIRERGPIHKDFNIKEKKGRFIMFAGAPSLKEKRKGFFYLVQSINRFAATLTPKERSKVILLLAGNIEQNIEKDFNVKVCKLGLLEYEKLAKAYSLADVYISPSIEDAGPSMVNQAIMSGTPVVAFNIGVAQDIVITGKTGYCAEVLDVEDFAKGINTIYSLSNEERLTIQQNCRELGVNQFSHAAFANQIQRYDREYCQ